MLDEDVKAKTSAAQAEYDRVMNGLEEKRKKLTSGSSPQSRVDAMNLLVQTENASHALQAAESKAIVSKYDPMIEKARAEGDALRQQIIDNNKKQREDPSYKYKEYSDKDEEIRAQLESVNRRFNEARSQRSAQLDASTERADARMAKIDGIRNEPQMNNVITATTSNTKVIPRSKDFEAMAKELDNMFKDNAWYQNNKSKHDDGKLYLPPLANDKLAETCTSLAKNDRSFILCDGQGNVMGYAQNGKFCHPDGKEYKSGDELKATGGALGNFKMPVSSPTPEPEKGLSAPKAAFPAGLSAPSSSSSSKIMDKGADTPKNESDPEQTLTI